MVKKCHEIIKMEYKKKEEKEKEKTLIPIIKEENDDKSDKKRSKTKNKIKYISNTKENTLKIFQLIKTKRNEKNMFEEKMKETKSFIKENLEENYKKKFNFNYKRNTFEFA